MSTKALDELLQRVIATTAAEHAQVSVGQGNVCLSSQAWTAVGALYLLLLPELLLPLELDLTLLPRLSLSLDEASSEEDELLALDLDLLLDPPPLLLPIDLTSRSSSLELLLLLDRALFLLDALSLPSRCANRRA